MTILFLYCRESVPKWVRAILFPLAEIDLIFLAREPYVGEIKGIARTLGVSVGYMMAVNLAYEATA